MRKILAVLTAIEAHLREINKHLVFLCYLAELSALNENKEGK
jgi:hypothetical protein